MNAGNAHFVTALFMPLPPETINLATAELDRYGDAPFGGAVAVALGIDYKVGRHEVCLFKNKVSMSASIMNALVLMLQMRAHRQEISWHTRTSSRKDKKTKQSTYKPLPKDLFFVLDSPFSSVLPMLQQCGLHSPSDLGLICKLIQYPLGPTGELDTDVELEMEPESLSSHRSDVQLCYAAVILDVQRRKLFFVDPIQRCTTEFKEQLRYR